MTLFDASFLGSSAALADPYPRYAPLRAKRGPFQFALPATEPAFAWALLGHADVHAALRNRVVFAPVSGEKGTHGTAHGELTAARVEALRPWVVRWCEELTAPLSGEVCVMAAYAAELMPLCIDGMDGANVAPWEAAIAKALLGNTLALVAQYPQLWQAVRQAPALIPRVVEESWRMETPVQRTSRRTTMDVAVGAALIPTDSAVVLFNGAANRDPAVWPDGEAFRIDRPTQSERPIGYDRACPGAQFARLLVKSTLHTFAATFRELHMAGTPARQTSTPDLLGYTHLPLQLTRG